MSIHQTDLPLFDYQVYRFGRARQVFRGPQPDLSNSYLCCIGATQTFGRYVNTPFPALLQEATGLACLNLGTEGAGPGYFVSDPEILRVASDARVAVVQVMSARNLSNRMFMVRPRRNARLHKPSELLAGLYPEVDFGRLAHVGTMLDRLHEIDPGRFRLVLEEMRSAWIARTRSLLAMIETRKVLLWFSEREPDGDGAAAGPPGAARYPHFVDAEMVEAVRTGADAFVKVVSSEGMPVDLTRDGAPVLFTPSGLPVEQNLRFPSPEMHACAAAALRPEIERLMAG